MVGGEVDQFLVEVDPLDGLATIGGFDGDGFGAGLAGLGSGGSAPDGSADLRSVA